MGGAVVVEALHKKLIKGVLGTAVLDVVEGTAIESLSRMNSILVHTLDSLFLIFL